MPIPKQPYVEVHFSFKLVNPPPGFKGISKEIYGGNEGFFNFKQLTMGYILRLRKFYLSCFGSSTKAHSWNDQIDELVKLINLLKMEDKDGIPDH